MVRKWLKCRVRVKPIPFQHIKAFLPTLGKLDQMLVYSSFGTIPKYFNEYDSDRGFMENIEKKILDKNSYLYAEGNRKIGNIAASLGVNSSYLSKYMLKLIELDLVEKRSLLRRKIPLKAKWIFTGSKTSF